MNRKSNQIVTSAHILAVAAATHQNPGILEYFLKFIYWKMISIFWRFLIVCPKGRPGRLEIVSEVFSGMERKSTKNGRWEGRNRRVTTISTLRTSISHRFCCLTGKDFQKRSLPCQVPDLFWEASDFLGTRFEFWIFKISCLWNWSVFTWNFNRTDSTFPTAMVSQCTFTELILLFRLSWCCLPLLLSSFTFHFSPQENHVCRMSENHEDEHAVISLEHAVTHFFYIETPSFYNRSPKFASLVRR